MSTLQIHLGDEFAGTGRRIMYAIARHEKGEGVVEHHLTFKNWQTFARVMTANRLDLLRHIHRAARARARARSAGTTGASMRM